LLMKEILVTDEFGRRCSRGVTVLLLLVLVAAVEGTRVIERVA